VVAVVVLLSLLFKMPAPPRPNAALQGVSEADLLRSQDQVSTEGGVLFNKLDQAIAAGALFGLQPVTPSRNALLDQRAGIVGGQRLGEDLANP
jgi:hypothetical protein